MTAERGTSQAENRPTARRAPSIAFGTKSSRKSAERRAINFRPDCIQLPSKFARQTNSKTSQQANHFVGCGAKFDEKID